MARPVIAHVVNSLATGGLENGVVNLANATVDRFDHVIVCLTALGALEWRLHPGVRVVSMNNRPGRQIANLLQLARTLRRLGPRIVHSRNWPAMDAVIAARLARASVVVHGEHGREASDPDGLDPRRKRIRRLLQPFITRFVCVSLELGRWLVEDIGVPSSKVETIHNGVDVARFITPDKSSARSALGIGPNDLVVGSVGRLDPVKGHASLIGAFATLAPRFPSSVLIIAGDGPLRGDLERLVDELALRNRVRLLGERRDVPTVLAALDIFVLPSLAEGMSNTILEAMASALPVVATRVGGNPELVESGSTGMLVPASDRGALVHAIEMYLDDGHLRHLHGKNGRGRTVEHFSLARMADDYSTLYRNLARRSAGR